MGSVVCFINFLHVCAFLYILYVLPSDIFAFVFYLDACMCIQMCAPSAIVVHVDIMCGPKLSVGVGVVKSEFDVSLVTV